MEGRDCQDCRFTAVTLPGTLPALRLTHCTVCIALTESALELSGFGGLIVYYLLLMCLGSGCVCVQYISLFLMVAALPRNATSLPRNGLLGPQADMFQKDTQIMQRY